MNEWIRARFPTNILTVESALSQQHMCGQFHVSFLGMCSFFVFYKLQHSSQSSHLIEIRTNACQPNNFFPGAHRPFSRATQPHAYGSWTYVKSENSVFYYQRHRRNVRVRVGCRLSLFQSHFRYARCLIHLKCPSQLCPRQMKSYHDCQWMMVRILFVVFVAHPRL